MANEFRITSWNINGIKTFEKSLKTVIDDFQSHIICFQEIKSSKETIERKNAIIEGYNSYISFCKTKPGYSGVGIYCKNPIKPKCVEENMVGCIKRLSCVLKDESNVCEELSISYYDLEALEAEGRVLICQFVMNNEHDLFVVNVYCPRADEDNLERMKYKNKFNALVGLTMRVIIEGGYHAILLGDLNVSHTDKDAADMVDGMTMTTCLTSPSRIWLNNLLVRSQKWEKLATNETGEAISSFIDTYRYKYPLKQDVYSCWNTRMNCRPTNLGSRIDYILCSMSMAANVCDGDVLMSVMGSDHCPVSAMFSDMSISSGTVTGDVVSIPSSLATLHFPRFRCQTDIKSYLIITARPNGTDSVSSKKRAAEPAKTTTINNKVPKNDKLLVGKSKMQLAWSQILTGTKKVKPPLCYKHNEICVSRTVTKATENKGRKFWACARPTGRVGDIAGRCNFFQWVD